MILLSVVAASLALVLWTVFRWPAVYPHEGGAAAVSVLIPARDEAANIGPCLAAVLGERCVAEVLVYDDHSSDATAGIVTAFRARDPRVRLAVTEPLPVGWCGKNFACAMLARQAGCEWLLFLDADTRVQPGGVAAMVREAQLRSATLLSCWPGLVMGSFWEKLLMPMLHFVVFSIYPAPLALIRRDASLGLAHGACILAWSSAYRAVGGHSAVASRVFEDTALARIWRERGQHSVCLDGQRVVRVRMYDGLRAIWLGFEKNFRAGFATSGGFWAFLLFHAVFFLAPFTVNWPAAAAVIAIRLLLAARFRHPIWSAFLHPFAECFLLALGLSSWWRTRSGRGVTWKGRRYLQT